MCNNSRIRDDVLYGQPTEGALLALSMKVCIATIGHNDCEREFL